MGLFLPTQNYPAFGYSAIIFQIRRVYRHPKLVLFPELQAIYFPPQFKEGRGRTSVFACRWTRGRPIQLNNKKICIQSLIEYCIIRHVTGEVPRFVKTLLNQLVVIFRSSDHRTLATPSHKVTALLTSSISPPLSVQK
jgi:hypothetical protein